MVKSEKVTELQCMFLNSCQLRVLPRRDDESFYVCTQECPREAKAREQGDE